MKVKLLVFCICLLCTSPIFAENWFAGGSIFFNFTTDERSIYDGRTISINDSRRSIIISPTVGYRLERFDLGISPLFQFGQAESRSQVNSEVSLSQFDILGIGIGLFSRYNFLSFGNFSVLGILSIDYLYSTSTSRSTHPQSSFAGEEKTHRIGINLRPAFEYRLTDHLSLYTNFGIGGIGGSYGHITRTSRSSFIDPEQNRSSTQRGSIFSLHIPTIFNVNITEFALGFHVHF